MIHKLIKKLKPPYVVKIKNVPWIQDKDGYDEGFAVWPFVFITNPDNEKLLYHELVHHKQQVRELHIFFYIRYFYYNITRGYVNNPYEIEARKETEQWWNNRGN